MELTREQCRNIKGCAILMIMIHNFVDHPLHIDCNEMFYSQGATDAFLANLFTESSIWYIFSFAGWIGVALFMFLSGYGLCRKYDNHPVNTGSYIWSHAVKLWKLLIPVYLTYVAVSSLLFNEDYWLRSIIAQITLTINPLDYGNSGFVINPGVYWFFGAIMQFYLLFLILRKLSVKSLWVLTCIFIGIHYIVLFVIAHNEFMTWTRHNFIGWAVPFLLGMIAARTRLAPSKRVLVIVGIVSFIFLSISMISKALSPFTEVFTILLFASIFQLFSWRAFSFLGTISASIFVIHPFVRIIFYNVTDVAGHTLALTSAYFVITVIVSFLHNRLLNQTGKKRDPASAE